MNTPKFEDRQYQTDTVEKWFQVIDNEPSKRPVVAVPTGAGKTVIMGRLIQKYLNKHPEDRVLVLAHTQEILEQNQDALAKIFPDKTIGMYSAGLGTKNICQITIAGIHSVYQKPHLFEFTNLFVIDECHAVNHQSEGMYRSFLENMRGIIIGMSATIFRTGHGYIYEDTGLFDTLAYDLTSPTNFNKLIEDGYLCKLIPVAPEGQLDTKFLKKSAGDFNIKQMSKRYSRNEITDRALENVLKYSKKYKKWLIFATDTTHANHIHSRLIRLGINTDILHSKINVDRKEVLDKFKDGNTQALVSVGMITTGFDAPNVDLIILLRPTMSAVLHVQMVGRGLRPFPGKDHCLVLDFAGNTRRLGPINDVIVPKTSRSKEKGIAPVKKCPVCFTLVPTLTRDCPSCGHKFEFKTKLNEIADTSELIAKQKKDLKQWLRVQDVRYEVHRKQGGYQSLMVIYFCGLQKVKDWICLDHPVGNWAKTKADHWVRSRGYQGPLTVSDVFQNAEQLKKPSQILVDFSDKWPKINNARF